MWTEAVCRKKMVTVDVNAREAKKGLEQEPPQQQWHKVKCSEQKNNLSRSDIIHLFTLL
jgi:hypothetical protein